MKLLVDMNLSPRWALFLAASKSKPFTRQGSGERQSVDVQQRPVKPGGPSGGLIRYRK